MQINLKPKIRLVRDPNHILVLSRPAVGLLFPQTMQFRRCFRRGFRLRMSSKAEVKHFVGLAAC